MRLLLKIVAIVALAAGLSVATTTLAAGFGVEGDSEYGGGFNNYSNALPSKGTFGAPPYVDQSNGITPVPEPGTTGRSAAVDGRLARHRPRAVRSAPRP